MIQSEFRILCFRKLDHISRDEKVRVVAVPRHYQLNSCVMSSTRNTESRLDRN